MRNRLEPCMHQHSDPPLNERSPQTMGIVEGAAKYCTGKHSESNYKAPYDANQASTGHNWRHISECLSAVLSVHAGGRDA